MTIVKPSLFPGGGSSPLCSLKSSLLTVAILTFVSLFYLSHNSLRTSPPSPVVVTPIHVPQTFAKEDKTDNNDDDGTAPTTGEDNYSDVYHSPESFRLNYAEMEKRFKVYIYPDGDPNTLQGTSYENMTVIVQDYVDGLIAKYPYWNRTLGADHFFVTCHDVGVRAFEGSPLLIKNIIRVVCSPSYNVGFIPHKDVALPQVLQPFALPAGGNDVENRTTLGFWAGHRNSKIRVILARVWENDTELDISNNRINRATGHLVYQKRFYRTKFCICPGGSQVNSARITDSIHYGCVPVILSDYYDLPFNDILDWRKFAVVLRERDVYNLKQILKNIPQSEFVSLHNNLVKVQKHIQWNSPPVKFDAFHMIMYELWLRHHVIKY
ncbi:PREDICTED: probable glycosyltransferase At5g11130 [Camelina sativa]|uniref:Probable glycosyltransferase At5g11130 n=1 Tax=Camelina sativa TaxID=90675 RepID=A0ABM1QHE5_CAMSA|nr:PREDICTED: probable glycosyltransferase At5g11130 [Camelina sativa]